VTAELNVPVWPGDGIASTPTVATTIAAMNIQKRRNCGV
jgi:hypothetical protein